MKLVQANNYNKMLHDFLCSATPWFDFFRLEVARDITYIYTCIEMSGDRVGGCI